jgi:hypothetical protein
MPRRRRPVLIAGPYVAPLLSKGQRATCLYRDADVIVTGWTTAPIAWPPCRAIGTHGGGSGLLVDEELARAVRTESSAAIQHWFGVTHDDVVARWRRALGVKQWEPEGSRRLHRQNSEKGAAGMKRRE